MLNCLLTFKLKLVTFHLYFLPEFSFTERKFSSSWSFCHQVVFTPFSWWLEPSSAFCRHQVIFVFILKKLLPPSCFLPQSLPPKGESCFLLPSSVFFERLRNNFSKSFFFFQKLAKINFPQIEVANTKVPSKEPFSN